MFHEMYKKGDIIQVKFGQDFVPAVITYLRCIHEDDGLIHYDVIVHTKDYPVSCHPFRAANFKKASIFNVIQFYYQTYPAKFKKYLNSKLSALKNKLTKVKK